MDRFRSLCKVFVGSGVLLMSSACCSSERRLHVSQERVDLSVGDSVRIQWSVSSGSDGSFVCYPVTHYESFEAPERFRWESSDRRIATVDATGMIRGVEPGVAVVVGITGNLRESTRVTVRAVSAAP
jgi:hypothetical protein